jgi:hypothetical protein
MLEANVVQTSKLNAPSLGASNDGMIRPKNEPALRIESYEPDEGTGLTKSRLTHQVKCQVPINTMRDDVEL